MRALTVFVCLCLALPALHSGEAESATADVVVYGATPGGIFAAIAAAKEGCSVLLADPTRHIGGMVTNGLTHTDYHAYEGITGSYLKFTQRCMAYYEKKYGKDSEQARMCWQGTQCEPHVTELVLKEMLAEHPAIKVELRASLASVERSADGTRIVKAVFAAAGGRTIQAAGLCFIDGSYEGDLLAAAGEKWRVGREGKDEYGESLAPDQPDGELQAYNFRLSMTNRADNRAPIPAPPGYDRAEFTGVLPLLNDGRVKTVFCPWNGGMYKAQDPSLPNGKFDINDVSHAPVRLSMPGENLGWPTGGPVERKRIYDRHLRYNLGLLYFLQNDAAVPEAFQKEAREWGLSKDEFTDNGHIPEQLYIREARRLEGQYVYTEKDTSSPEGEWRAVLRKDAIAIGEYSHNCHGTGHSGPFYGGKHTGEFYKATAPYQIPLGVIVPKVNANLLVPVAISASHVGFCALRLEPIWGVMGQAAGFAAAQSVKEKIPVQKLDSAKIQRTLHADGCATVYIGDVLPGHADFAAVQWWGTLGGLHGLSVRTGKAAQRGAKIQGQYFQSYPGHNAELDTPLDDTLKSRWLALAKDAGVAEEPLRAASTRGAFIRAAYAARK